MLEMKLKELFARVLKLSSPDIITDYSSPDVINSWDSINHLNLVVAAEEVFSVDIEPEEIPNMMLSFNAFKSVLQNKLA